MSVSASAVNTNTLTQTAQNGFIKYIEFDELRDLFQDFPIEIAMYDQEGNYKFVNKLYARDEELRKSLIDQNDEFFFNQMGITPDSAVKRKTFFHQALEEKRTIGFTEKLFLPKENKTLYYKRYFRPLFSNRDSREITHVFLFGTNLNAAVMGQKELRYLAYHDRLTGLKNRTAFNEQLDQIQNESERYEDQRQIAILTCDLDNFQFINEEMGHDIGDELLKEVAARLQLFMRKSDYIYRTDGDEFAIIVQNIKDEFEAGKIAEKITEYLTKSYRFNGQRIDSLTTSIGIVLFPKDGKDLRTLVKNAETALYSAKNNGKNTFQFFSKARTEYSVRVLQIEKKLSELIKNKEFEEQFTVLYQPLVVKRNHEYKIFGSEALIRWTNPELGSVRPDTFIPVAEKTNLISEIGEWIFTRACNDYMNLVKKINQPLVLSVNFSAKQLRSKEMISKLEHVLNVTHFDPKYLQLELTETSYLDDQIQVVQNIRALEEMGIKMALDDFGVGYASLSYLHRVPAATIKIDRSFITHLGTSKRHRELVKSIILLGKNLNKDVVAEGVERVEDLYLLDEQQCFKYQGFLFSDAINLKSFERLLERESLLSTVIKRG
jgi:diguanylate cyclase (GGDEF)-like protein